MSEIKRAVLRQGQFHIVFFAANKATPVPDIPLLGEEHSSNIFNAAVLLGTKLIIVIVILVAAEGRAPKAFGVD